MRLACLIHSASVCPEPGSNSPKKRNQTDGRNHPKFPERVPRRSLPSAIQLLKCAGLSQSPKDQISSFERGCQPLSLLRLRDSLPSHRKGPLSRGDRASMHTARSAGQWPKCKVLGAGCWNDTPSCSLGKDEFRQGDAGFPGDGVQQVHSLAFLIYRRVPQLPGAGSDFAANAGDEGEVGAFV